MAIASIAPATSRSIMPGRAIFIALVCIRYATSSAASICSISSDDLNDRCWTTARIKGSETREATASGSIPSNDRILSTFSGRYCGRKWIGRFRVSAFFSTDSSSRLGAVCATPQRSHFSRNGGCGPVQTMSSTVKSSPNMHAVPSSASMTAARSGSSSPKKYRNELSCRKGYVLST